MKMRVVMTSTVGGCVLDDGPDGSLVIAVSHRIHPDGTVEFIPEGLLGGIDGSHRTLVDATEILFDEDIDTREEVPRDF